MLYDVYLVYKSCMRLQNVYGYDLCPPNRTYKSHIVTCALNFEKKPLS